MTRASDEQIAALLSKREAIINRLCAEKKQLELQLVKARAALEWIVEQRWNGDVDIEDIVICANGALTRK